MKWKAFSFCVLLISLNSASSWACRPNIYAISETHAQKALSELFAQEHQSVFHLIKIEKLGFSMRFVNSDPGVGCPDSYRFQFRAQYKQGEKLASYYVEVLSWPGKELQTTIQPETTSGNPQK